MNPGMRELAGGFVEMVAPKKNRRSPRAQVSLVARYRSPTAFEFVQEECFDLSLGGMFIRSPAPAPAGTLIKLECDVNGATGTIRGVARVVWLREHSADGQPAGMGVKFVKLESGAREVIAGILEQLGAERDDRDTARPPAAPAAASQPFKQTPSARPNTQAAANASASSKPSSSQPSAPKASDPAPQKAGASPVPALGPLTDSGRPAAPDLRGRLEQAKRIQAEQEAAAVRAGAATADTKKSAPSKPSTSAAEKRASASSEPRAPAPAVTAVAPAATVSASSNKGLAYALVALVAGGVLFVVVSRKPAPATDASAHAATMQPEPTPASSAIERPAPPAAYVLEVATTPDGARVTAGARELTTPGSIELGQLEEPVQLMAEKDGFEPTSATIDRVGFMLEDGAMRRRIELTLTARAAQAVPEPEPVAAPEPAPIAAPAPAPAAAKLAAKSDTKSETKSSRRAREANTQPAARTAAPAEAPVAAAAPVEAPAPAVVEEPKPEPAPAAPVLTIAPAGEPKPAAEPKPAPAPAPEAKPAERQFVEAKPVEPAKKPDPKLTPMQNAAACLSTGDNACVVKALEGKAKSAQELELLIETYKAMGDSGKAEKWMKTYVDKYPTERRANTYRRVLDRPKAEAAAAP
jgi:hypothetical protein